MAGKPPNLHPANRCKASALTSPPSGNLGMPHVDIGSLAGSLADMPALQQLDAHMIVGRERPKDFPPGASNAYLYPTIRVSAQQ